ncbi:dTDP-glucose 4,6-dehydratase [Candidatus Peregrinibacteria bacterium]|nr:MAG: dTDP-glucose 4,6-dehydratase [Candidatus Peregrinibacteria bacterium]
MKVLITGGAGFIGTNYVYAHLARHPQDELWVLDALTYSGHRENLAEAEAKGVHFIEGRIEDVPFVRDLFETVGFDLVVHFAAESHVDRSIKNPAAFVLTNVVGTQTLLDAARDFEVKRFHHISTDEVYGDLGFGSKERFNENSPIRPSSPYSASKAASDFLVLSYLKTYGLPVTLSRCSNNYGPYQSLENLIPLLISKAVEGGALPLYGTGKNVRDWLFVEDHCEAILTILEKGKIGEIYNIGGDSEQENVEVAQNILQILKKPESLIHFVEDRKGHDERYAIDFSKLKTELGWSPKMNFEEGMRRTVEWYTLSTYERSPTRGGNRISARSTHQSHEQTSAAGL